MTLSIDPYVLGLVVTSTPCFGYHEAGNAMCGDCPLSGRCIEARALRAVTVSAQLVKASAARAAARAAKTAAAAAPTPPAAVPATVSESIDDILASISRAPNTVQAAATPAVVQPAMDFDLDSLFSGLTTATPVSAPVPPPAAATAASTRVTVMKAVIDSVCFVCNGKVPAKTEAAFIPGKGLRHMTCV